MKFVMSYMSSGDSDFYLVKIYLYLKEIKIRLQMSNCNPNVYGSAGAALKFCLP